MINTENADAEEEADKEIKKNGDVESNAGRKKQGKREEDQIVYAPLKASDSLSLSLFLNRRAT